VLLLDEVAAHLDAGRRAALFDILDELGCQSFMTGTERELFGSLEGRAQFLRVSDGEVREDV
jgi:DNA replication and repair protein RecF